MGKRAKAGLRSGTTVDPQFDEALGVDVPESLPPPQFGDYTFLMANNSNFLQALRTTVKAAGIIFAAMFAVMLLRALIDRPSALRSPTTWAVAISFSAAMAALWSLLIIVQAIFAARRAQPVSEILMQEPEPAERLQTPWSAFVAMEYYAGILNRTFIIFIAPEGLYGWRAHGCVTNADQNYFEPLQQMIADDDLLGDRTAMIRLSQLPGGFFLDRKSIASVEGSDRSKWGMGGIPHSGRIWIRLRSGQKREFIVLGAVSLEQIRDRIVTGCGVALIGA